MFNLDPEKLLILAVVAVLVLGPDKLPQAARQAGAAWRTFTQFRHRMEAEVRGQLPDLPSSTEIARLARSPSALLNRLSTMDGDGATATAAVGGVEVGDLGADGVTEGVVANGTLHGNGTGNGSVPPDTSSAAPVAPTPTPVPAPLPEEVATFGDPSLN
jgi:sec-independent protein translocase protein TatB